MFLMMPLFFNPLIYHNTVEFCPNFDQYVNKSSCMNVVAKIEIFQNRLFHSNIDMKNEISEAIHAKDRYLILFNFNWLPIDKM